MGHKVNVAAGTWGYGFMNVVELGSQNRRDARGADPRGVSGSGQVR